MCTRYIYIYIYSSHKEGRLQFHSPSERPKQVGAGCTYMFYSAKLSCERMWHRADRCRTAPPGPSRATRSGQQASTRPLRRTWTKLNNSDNNGSPIRICIGQSPTHRRHRHTAAVGRMNLAFSTVFVLTPSTVHCVLLPPL